MNINELIVQTIENDPEMQALGVVPGAVYQPDTADSPMERPFLVLRWSSSDTSVGSMVRRPVAVWVYDNMGDLTRVRGIIRRLRTLFPPIDPVKLDDGWLHSFGVGVTSADLYDDGFNAALISQELIVVAEWN